MENGMRNSRWLGDKYGSIGFDRKDKSYTRIYIIWRLKYHNRLINRALKCFSAKRKIHAFFSINYIFGPISQSDDKIKVLSHWQDCEPTTAFAWHPAKLTSIRNMSIAGKVKGSIRKKCWKALWKTTVRTNRPIVFLPECLPSIHFASVRQS